MANKDFASEMNGTFELQLIIEMKLGFCSSIIMLIELQKFSFSSSIIMLIGLQKFSLECITFL